MNRIKFKYPPFFIPYLNLQQKEASVLNVNFEEEGYLIDVEAIYYLSEYNHGKYIYITEFRFGVEEGTKRKGALSQLAENPDKYPELLSLLASFINVLHRNIRNFGMIPDVNEIYPIKDYAKNYLNRWNVEICEKNGSWRKIIPEPKKLEENLFLLLLPSYEEPKKYPIMIESDKWQDIKFAIKANREPPPEHEFMVNAIEFIRLRNWRLALLESITCLEIVLSQFLREYFKHKNVPPNSIDKFFKPAGIGLTARISVLLNITLSPVYLSIINIDNVIKAIEWRNIILHRTGHLPKNLNPEDVKNTIWNVLKLVDILSLEREQLKASPEMKSIGEEISKNYNISIPKIWILRNHEIFIKFVFFYIEDIERLLKENILNELIKSISDRLSKRDKLFKANKHLHISFSKFPKEVFARWHKGKFELVQKELSKN